MVSRTEKIYSGLESNGLDGLIVSSQSNISYACQYNCRDAYLLISKRGSIYFTDSRYIEEVQRKLSAFRIKRINGSAFKIIADTACELKLKRIGFEERNLTYAEYAKIKGHLAKSMKLIPTHNIIETLRQIKDTYELANIRKALRITESAIRFIKKYLTPGIRELEIVAELERFIRYKGATGSAFDIIVASGPNSSFPHHLSSSKKLKSNEPVLIDIGVDYSGYKSDLTRVFFLGKISVLGSKIYNIVKEAQAKAIEKIRPGVKISEVDKAARRHIIKQGYGNLFEHNTGHGIGLEIHETPHICPQEDNQLKPGMVLTVEPGIYVPNKFGIRIEDMVLVKENGCEVLSGSINK